VVVVVVVVMMIRRKMSRKIWRSIFVIGCEGIILNESILST